MMKARKKAVIYLLVTLLWTAVIFSFSLQPADASANLSGGLLQHLLNWFYGLTGIEIPTYFAHFLIRKLAHFSEFFLLGILAFHASRHLFQKSYPALCYGILVAVTDEHIQHFTGGGRAMRIGDMLLDTVGVAAAIWIINMLIKKHKKPKRAKKLHKHKEIEKRV